MLLRKIANLIGGLLFLLSAGFSLIFGLMRIANLSHGAYFMLGAYVGLSVLRAGYPFGVAMLAGDHPVPPISSSASRRFGRKRSLNRINMR